jgi:hypothetical protein
MTSGFNYRCDDTDTAARIVTGREIMHDFNPVADGTVRPAAPTTTMSFGFSILA